MRYAITTTITVDAANVTAGDVRAYAPDALRTALAQGYRGNGNGVTLVDVTVSDVVEVAAPVDVTPRTDAERAAIAAALTAFRNAQQ